MGNYSSAPWSDADGNARIIIDDAGREVAEMSNSVFRSANARLVSAAPELLEALKKCTQVSECAGDEWISLVIRRKDFHLAQAAIEKATGQRSSEGVL